MRLKNSLCFVTGLLTVFLAVPMPVFGDVSVRGYTRKDGTYVGPSHRSSPDGNFNNNWSTKGNINPYTGVMGTRVSPPGLGSLGASSTPYPTSSSLFIGSPGSFSGMQNRFGGMPMTFNQSFPGSTASFNTSTYYGTSSIPSMTSSATSGSPVYLPGNFSSMAVNPSVFSAQPRTTDDWESVGDHFMDIGEFDDAVLSYGHAINFEFRTILRVKLAYAYFQMAKTLDPADSIPFFHRSIAIYSTSMTKQFLNAAIKAINLDPDSPADRLRLAEAARLSNDPCGEIIECSSAAGLSPYKPEPVLRLSQAYARYGLTNTAVKMCGLASAVGADQDSVAKIVAECQNSNSSVFPKYYFMEDQ